MILIIFTLHFYSFEDSSGDDKDICTGTNPLNSLKAYSHPECPENTIIATNDWADPDVSRASSRPFRVPRIFCPRTSIRARNQRVRLGRLRLRSAARSGLVVNGGHGERADGTDLPHSGERSRERSEDPGGLQLDQFDF